MDSPRPEPIVIKGEAIAAVAKVCAAKPSQSDIDSAMPPECAVKRVDERGREHTDYIGVPLRNADGTPNKYAKRLGELHKKQATLGAALSAELGAQQPQPEVVVDREGRKLELPARMAEAVAKARGLLPVRHTSKYIKTRTWYRTDGTVVRFERRGGKIVEVPA